MLEFCPVCKGLLQIKNENGKNIGYCSCGFKRTSGIELSSVDKTNMDNLKTGEGVASGDESSIEVDRFCKKCGYDKAEVDEIQANESSIFIYKCLKCKAVERETQGSSKF